MILYIYILYYFDYINFFCYRLCLVIVLIGCRVYLSKKNTLQFDYSNVFYVLKVRDT